MEISQLATTRNAEFFERIVLTLQCTGTQLLGRDFFISISRDHALDHLFGLMNDVIRRKQPNAARHGVERDQVILPLSTTATWPRWSIPLYLFSATLPCDVLSAFLSFCDRVVYRHYESVPRVFGISALQDQELAAALMWVCVTLIYLIPAVVVSIEILSPRRLEAISR